MSIQMPEIPMNVVSLKQIGKTYHLDAVDVPALIDIDLEIRPDCFTVISGPSGSGATTIWPIFARARLALSSRTSICCRC